MSYKVTLLPGDGIGPEVAGAMRKCVDAAGVDIEWDVQEVGAPAIEKWGTPLPASAIEAIRKNKIAIKGPIETPIGKGFRSVNVELRQALDLFACVRPVRSIKGTQARYDNVDIMIFRENTEDLYAGIEFDVHSPEANALIPMINSMSDRQIRDDSAISIKPISVFGSERIIRAAFEYAVANNRKKVSVVHKANIMKYTDGLFLKKAREIAKEYEGQVEFWDVIIDALCMQLVMHPENFDVLVLPNLYGDIVSDLCAGLVGGLGMAPGSNMGEGVALFEPVHGSAPKHAGKNVVNPTATIFSAVMMLRHIGEQDAATRLEKAVCDVIAEGVSVTYDLKGSKEGAVGTQEMAEAICKKLKG